MTLFEAKKLALLERVPIVIREGFPNLILASGYHFVDGFSMG
jgi:hypothetical protein